MVDKFEIPAYVKGFRTLSDGSLSLNFHTNEVTAEDIVHLRNQHNKFGWLLFSPNQFSEKDIPEFEPEEEGGKSMSQRIRGALFIYWKKVLKEDPADFEQYYRTALGKYLNSIKAKLPATPEDFKKF